MVRGRLLSLGSSSVLPGTVQVQEQTEPITSQAASGLVNTFDCLSKTHGRLSPSSDISRQGSVIWRMHWARQFLTESQGIDRWANWVVSLDNSDERSDQSFSVADLGCVGHDLGSLFPCLLHPWGFRRSFPWLSQFSCSSKRTLDLLEGGCGLGPAQIAQMERQPNWAGSNPCPEEPAGHGLVAVTPSSCLILPKEVCLSILSGLCWP